MATIFAAGLSVCCQDSSQSQPRSYIEANTSWIGNTFGHAANKWVQIDAQGMYVAPDGTLFTNSFWDEGGKEAGIYGNGDALGQLKDTHGWGRVGGLAVTANSKYVYAAMRQESHVDDGTGYPPEGTTWYCVRRYLNDGSGNPAPFPAGAGHDGSMLVVQSLATGTADVRGLAADSTNLYVSDGYANQIRVYDAGTMAPIASWSLARPRQLTVGSDGTLWVIQEGDGVVGSKILHYSTEGTPLPQQITDVTAPTALDVDEQGRLLVADNGPDQQVKIYDDLETTPKLIGTVGERGGVFGGTPGKVGPLRFGGLIGIGSDRAGNLYVGYNGVGPNAQPEGAGTGLVLQSYSPARQLNWELLGLEFVDNADVDPGSDGQDVYTKDEHFRMNPNKPDGARWHYVGQTVDPFKYPEDPRLHLGQINPAAPFFRRIRGKPFLFVTDMYSQFLQIYRFDPATDGEVAIPSSLFSKDHYDDAWPPYQPPTGEWIWRDKNSDGSPDATEYDVRDPSSTPQLWGWWVDGKGDVWQANRHEGIRRFPLQGLDAHGNPIYTYASMQTVPAPAPFAGQGGDLQRIDYDSQDDVMYLAGYTSEHPDPTTLGQSSDWGKIGTVLARYDNWSSGNRTPRWQIILPDDDGESKLPKGLSVAGDELFVAYSHTAEVHAYDSKTGESQGIISPGPEVDSTSGWIDIPYGVRAYQRSDGEYLVFVEEDGYGKVIMYRWDGKTDDNQTRVDDNDSAVAFKGAWETRTALPANAGDSAAYNGTFHATRTAGASASYTFSGSSIALRGTRMFDHGGTARIYIDDTLERTVSYEYPSDGDRRIIFSKTGLNPGRHTIKVVSTGDGPINVDAFQHTPAPG